MKVVSPKVLHLATHGFFLPEMELQVERGRMLVNRPDRELSRMTHPMHRSGLALAGAQRTMESWAQGNFPPFNRDGVLMAEEVGLLKLEGTWLVTLSACETGTGESRSGEGVLGLRRGFVQAGAENLLMTLWAVNDEATMQFMLEFYDRALESRNPAEALGAVQREWLVRVRGEKGLVAAVNLAGPFILSSVGPSQ
jgi:CHAT domain-containing protein